MTVVLIWRMNLTEHTYFKWNPAISVSKKWIRCLGCVFPQARSGSLSAGDAWKLCDQTIRTISMGERGRIEKTKNERSWNLRLPTVGLLQHWSSLISFLIIGIVSIREKISSKDTLLDLNFTPPSLPSSNNWNPKLDTVNCLLISSNSSDPLERIHVDKISVCKCTGPFFYLHFKGKARRFPRWWEEGNDHTVFPKMVFQWNRLKRHDDYRIDECE